MQVLGPVTINLAQYTLQEFTVDI